MLVEDSFDKVMCVWGRLISSKGVLTLVRGRFPKWILSALNLAGCIKGLG